MDFPGDIWLRLLQYLPYQDRLFVWKVFAPALRSYVTCAASVVPGFACQIELATFPALHTLRLVVPTALVKDLFPSILADFEAHGDVVLSLSRNGFIIFKLFHKLVAGYTLEGLHRIRVLARGQSECNGAMSLLHSCIRLQHFDMRALVPWQLNISLDRPDVSNMRLQRLTVTSVRRSWAEGTLLDISDHVPDELARPEQPGRMLPQLATFPAAQPKSHKAGTHIGRPPRQVRLQAEPTLAARPVLDQDAGELRRPRSAPSRVWSSLDGLLSFVPSRASGAPHLA